MPAGVEITFLGCGDAFGSGGRLNTCFMVDAPDLRFLIDCGATSMVAMAREGVNPDGIDAVFLTHLHGDHFAGLCFMLLKAALEKSRDKSLDIAGPKGVEASIRRALEALFPGSGETEFPFEVRFHEHSAGETAEIRGVRVTPFTALHGSGMDCYSLRLEVAGRTIAYSGDTAWGDNVVAAGRGADLLIAESYFPDRVVGRHTSCFQLVENREAIGARRIVLTHMSEAMLAVADEAPFEAARDGLKITV